MKYHTLLMILVSLFATFFQSLMPVKSFNFNLIHRDSPGSPFYNKSISQSEILVKDARRSHAQVSRLRNSSSTYTKELIEYTMESSYLIKYSLGSKKFEVSAFASLVTGFTWTKCLSNHQRPEEKFYKPDESESYKTLKNNEDTCKWFPFSKQDSSSADCAYEYEEDEKVSTQGVISTDKISFYSLHAGMVVEYGDIFFGCSHINEGFASEVQGIFGFGRGTTSVLSMLNERTKYRFGYCLRATTSKEKLGIFRFGHNSGRTDTSMTSIPFEGSTGYYDRTIAYYLRLDGVSIGDHFIGTKSRQLIRIDLGISMTYLPKSIYESIENRVKRMFETDTDPLPEFKICFNKNKDNRNKLPKMKFLFNNDGLYTLGPSNIFAEVDNKFCLAIFEVDDDAISVFGSKAQENHIMHFDVDKNRFSFSLPRDCSSF